jgi:hypothetical protein
MKIQSILVGAIAAIAALGVSLPAQAETRNAFCKYFPNGATVAQAAMPCTVSSEVEVLDATIVWQDGVRQSFRNYGGGSFVYLDNLGGQVFKQLGLYDPSGRIDVESDRAYKMENGTVYIWWRR